MSWNDVGVRMNMEYKTMLDPFSLAGKWFKGNVHTHTNVSDGALSPADMVEQYRNFKDDFVFITDHRRIADVSNLSREHFLVLRGEEITCGRVKTGDCYDILALNVSREIPSDPGRNLQEVIDEVRRQGGLPILAHPYWSGMVSEDLAKIRDYIGMEVFNTSCFHHTGKGNASVYWDQLLFDGRFVYGFASDDAHYHFNDFRPNDTCGAWIMVKAAGLTEENVIVAIHKGLFYSSTGPVIHDIRVEGAKVYVKTSPVKRIVFVAEGAMSRCYTARAGGYLTEMEHFLNCKKYLRIECHDDQGRIAWSNPLFVNP